MGRPTEKTIKRLFALSGNNCAFPGCTSDIVESATAAAGEICHIRAQRAGGPRFDSSRISEDLHAFENLMLLCPNHHGIIDGQPALFTVEALQQMKATHERDAGRPERGEDLFCARILLRDLERINVSNNSGNVVVGSPGAIVGQTINIRAMRKTLKVQAPAGTLGADQQASRYIQYLISRYNKFASADGERTKPFNYGVISRNIEDKFRAPWRLLPLGDFGKVVDFLQRRISRTQIAKRNVAKGGRSFSSFSEYQS
jgi:hypothetical protein